MKISPQIGAVYKTDYEWEGYNYSCTFKVTVETARGYFDGGTSPEKSPYFLFGAINRKTNTPQSEEMSIPKGFFINSAFWKGAKPLEAHNHKLTSIFK
jgi:hypothetical protein